MSFEDLGLSEKVLTAVQAAGYTQATPIQSGAIPVAVTGRDILGIAQTGTGKTASFVLPMLTRLEAGRARARMPRSLIIAPTRELAAQVAEAFEVLGAKHKLTVALLIGGVSFDEQFRKLDRGADVLIATPGRLLDHHGRGKILLTGIEILVIDEADRMLDMGFIPDIEKICGLLPPRRQTLFFSATMPNEIQKLVAKFLDDPHRVEVARQSTTANTITQRFCYAPSDEKERREVLRDMMREQEIQNAIIFANRKRDVAILHRSLVKHGFNAGALHGDMDQRSRMATLDAFRAGEVTILAASDVAARGLDIPEVSHVFNFDVPVNAEDYVHRIGRTGRAGREGYAATLVTLEDHRVFKEILEMNPDQEVVWLGDEALPEDAAEQIKARKRGGRGGRSGAG
ncbi:MAG: DEAD/DEAH box helicase, partial [Pseudomonadota bacterium]